MVSSLLDFFCDLDFLLHGMALLLCIGLLVVSFPIYTPGKKKIMTLFSQAKPLHLFLKFFNYPTMLLLLLSLGSNTWQYLRQESNPYCLLRIYLTTFCFVGWCISYHLLFLIKDNPHLIIQAEEQGLAREMLAWKPPPLKMLDIQLSFYSWLTNPEFVGIDNVQLPTDQTSLMFVSNHALYGLEMPLLIHGLYKKKGIYPRGLADHLHFLFPVHKDILSFFGAVDGTRENCSLLMENGHHILVYPGGSHEVLKSSKDKKYGLLWKERLGFARIAIKNGATIIPTACVGTEDMLEIIQDIPIGWLIGRSEQFIPIARPSGPSQLQRIYFWFGQPISTRQYGGQCTQENCIRVRDKTKECVERGIQELMERRENDPQRMFSNRFSNEIRKLISASMEKVQCLFSFGSPSEEELNEKGKHVHQRIKSGESKTE